MTFAKKGGENIVASKRQRKKQQTKQNEKLLKSVGVTSKKQIKKLKNKPKETQQIYKKEQRKITANARSKLIQSLGYKVSDHSAKRYWSEERWNEWIKNEEVKRTKATKKERNDKDLYLLIFWRDKTAEGFADTDLIERYKYQYRHMDNDALLERINHYVRTPKAQGVEIGTTVSVLVKGSQRKQYINLYTHMSEVSNQMSDSNDWILVYEGKAKRYHDLLLAVHAVIRLLYDASERADFINTLLDRRLPQLNMNMAKRLAKDLNWRRF